MAPRADAPADSRRARPGGARSRRRSARGELPPRAGGVVEPAAATPQAEHRPDDGHGARRPLLLLRIRPAHDAERGLPGLARDPVPNARSVAPWTLPSHMSMFTGRRRAFSGGATWRHSASPGRPRALVEFGFAPRPSPSGCSARLRATSYHPRLQPQSLVSRSHGFAEGFEKFTSSGARKSRTRPQPEARDHAGGAARNESRGRGRRSRRRRGRMLAEHPRVPALLPVRELPRLAAPTTRRTPCAGASGARRRR
jgi:hypothetical protein